MQEAFFKENQKIWDEIYEGGASMMYPDDAFIRMSLSVFRFEHERAKVLDFGFGSGATTEFLARRGFQVDALELSGAAIQMTKARLEKEGLEATFHQYDGSTFPLEDNCYDGLVAWQVLTYNTPETMKAVIEEIDRVLKPGGIFLGAMSAPEDYIDRTSTGSEDGSKVMRADQGGARVVIPTRDNLKEDYFGSKNLKLGEFGASIEEYSDRSNRYWIMSYRK